MIYTMLSTLTITLLSLLMKKTIAWIFFANDSAESRCFYQIKRIGVIDMNVSSYKNERWIPWSMITDNRIFSRNFAVYGRMHTVFSLQTVVNHRPRLNKHGRKRPYTEKYDDLHVTVLRSYISVSFTKKYGDIRRKTTIVYDPRIRCPYTISVKIRCVKGPYMTVYGRICAVFFDQGQWFDSTEWNQ
jgi:hypothetical protein